MKHQEIRIIQLIDSLEAGGAERMAVNYANTLLCCVEFSGLVVSRKEGLLKAKVKSQVNYFFLNRKRILDIKAFMSFRNFLITNKVTHIQAHSSSFFMAVLVKILMPNIKIIWHDHYGKSEQLNERKFLLLKVFSLFFYRIISVNQILKSWALEKLWCPKVIYLQNFVGFEINNEASFILSSEEGKRIVCLANLRPQKNHLLLLDVAKKLKSVFPDWSFHLVGKDFEDEYSKRIKDKVKEHKLQDTVFLYGPVQNTKSVLEQADIVVLTSDSEGLPVSLLEAGLAGKPVVATAVGEIPNVISNDFGYIVKPNDIDQFFNKLIILVKNKDLREEMGKKFQNYVLKEFDSHLIINRYIDFLQ